MPLYAKRPHGLDFSKMPPEQLAALQADWDARWGAYTGDWVVVEGLPFPVSYREVDGVQTAIYCFDPVQPTDWPGCSSLRKDQITDINPRAAAAYHAMLWDQYLNMTGGIKFVARELLIAEGLLNETPTRAQFEATPGGPATPQEGTDRWGTITILPGKKVTTNEETSGRILRGVPEGPLPGPSTTVPVGPVGGEPFHPEGPLPGPSSGNEPPVGGEPNAPAGCEAKICGCINKQGDTIAEVLQQIADALNNRINPPMDTVDHCKSCVDAYIAGLLAKPKLTCQQCQQMAAYGMAGTVEYAVQCAQNICQPYSGQPPYPPTGQPPYTPPTTPPYTPPDSPEPDQPEPDQPQPDPTYTGWCSQSSGMIYVTKTEDGPPVADAIAVASGEDETAVATEAAKNCQPYSTYPPTSPTSLNTPGIFNPPACRIAQYMTADNLNAATIDGQNVNMAGAISQAWNAALAFGVDGLNLKNLADVTFGVARATFGGTPPAARILVPHLAAAAGCDNPIFKNVIALLANVGMIEKMLGVDIKEYLMSYQYAANLTCRQKFLLPNDAAAAYLTNAIDHTTADRLWGMHGFCAEPLDWYVHTNKARPDRLELSHLRRRAIISPSQYNSGMRELGFLEQPVADNLHRLTEQLPTLSDIIRLMVRDADDASIPDWEDSDRLFAQKYGAQLRQWAEWQGVPEDFAKYAWRAHWTIPPPTALFTFWHRFRRDPAFGTPEEQLAAIKGALIQQDILPRWHKYYLESAYRVLSRVDIRRIFNIGQMTESDVTLVYTKQGYSDEDAERLTKFAVRLRDDAIASHKWVKKWLKGHITRDAAKALLVEAGFPATKVEQALAESVASFDSGAAAKLFVAGFLNRAGFIAELVTHGVTEIEGAKIADRLSLRIVKSQKLGEYSVGLLDRDGAKNGLTADGFNDSVTNKLLSDIDSALKQKRTAACEAGVKRRFLTGDMDENAVVPHLGKFGINPNHAAASLAAWQCEKTAIGKQVPAAKLCAWLARGAITPANFLRRLTNLGFNQNDAAHMLDDCLISINVKRLAEAKKQAKEQAAQAAKEEAALRRADAAAQREASQIQRARDAAYKARLAREKQLFSAIDKMTDKCDCDTLTAKQFLTAEKQRLERDYGLTVDESLAVLLQSIEEWAGGEPQTLSATINIFADAAYHAEADSSTQEPLPPASTNGVTHPSA